MRDVCCNQRASRKKSQPFEYETKRKQRGARLGQHFLTGTVGGEKTCRFCKDHCKRHGARDRPRHGSAHKRTFGDWGARRRDRKGRNIGRSVGRNVRIRNSRTRANLRSFTGDVRDLDLKSNGRSASIFLPQIFRTTLPEKLSGNFFRPICSRRQWRFLIQKGSRDSEFVARDKKESILSISVKVYGTPSIAAVVSKGNFSSASVGRFSDTCREKHLEEILQEDSTRNSFSKLYEPDFHPNENCSREIWVNCSGKKLLQKRSRRQASTRKNAR